MVKNNKKPRLRFKGFTDEWEQRKLKELGKTFTGLSGKTSSDFGHGKAKFITYMNVFQNPIASKSETEPIEIDNRQNKVKYGDIFFTTSSETPEEVGMSSIWLENTENMYLNSFCFGYRLNNYEKINLQFLAYLLRAGNFRSNMMLLAQGISRYNISKNKVTEININLPIEIEEQKKIGILFYNLDNLITLHQRKYDKLLNVKKALLDKMFPKNQEKTPKIRFKGFFDAWEQRKLGEIVDYVVDNRGKNPDYYCDDGIPVIDNFMIGELYPDLKIANRFIDDNLFENFIRKYNNTDDILITLVGNGIGKMSLFPNKKAVIIQNTLGFRCEHNDKKFCYYELLSKNKEIISLDRGMAQPSIRQDELLDIIFYTTNLKEEKKIATILYQLDNLITLHQRKCEKLKNIKKALLDKMFV